jgi:hypothetical protein
MREKYTQISEDEFRCEKGISYRVGDVIALTPDISIGHDGLHSPGRVFKIARFNITELREGVSGYAPHESGNGQRFDFVYVDLTFQYSSGEVSSVHLSNIMRPCDYDVQRYVHDIPQLSSHAKSARINEWRALRAGLGFNKKYLLL